MLRACALYVRAGSVPRLTVDVCVVYLLTSAHVRDVLLLLRTQHLGHRARDRHLATGAEHRDASCQQNPRAETGADRRAAAARPGSRASGAAARVRSTRPRRVRSRPSRTPTDTL